MESGLRLSKQVAERLAVAVDALDFVLKARDDRTDVRERTADVFHVPLVRGDAVETELMGLVRDQRPVNQAVGGSERGEECGGIKQVAHRLSLRRPGPRPAQPRRRTPVKAPVLRQEGGVPVCRGRG